MENDGHSILVIADGAAFGPEMDRVMKVNAKNRQLTVYLPESFEWLILSSGVVAGKQLRSLLEDPAYLRGDVRDKIVAVMEKLQI